MDRRKATPSEKPEVMTVQELAGYLNCHPSTVYRLLKEEELPCFRLGGDWRFLRSEIDRWIASQQDRQHPLVPAKSDG